MRTNPRIYLEMTYFIFFGGVRAAQFRSDALSLGYRDVHAALDPQGLSMLERSFQHDPARNNARDTFWRVIY